MTDEGIDKKELLKEFSQAAAPETKAPEAPKPPAEEAPAEAPQAESPKPPRKPFKWTVFANVVTILIGIGWIVLGFLSRASLPYFVGVGFLLAGVGLMALERRARLKKEEPAAPVPAEGEEKGEAPRG